MDKNDKLIKELLEEGFLKKAPDNFTDNVMHAVAKESSPVSTGNEYPFSTYFMIIAGTVAAGVGILYFTNKAFLLKYLTYFNGFIGDLLPSFNELGKGFTSLNFQMPANGLVLGVGAIVLLLLVFDKLVLSKNRYFGIFVW